jgi:hypothetical protein
VSWHWCPWARAGFTHRWRRLREIAGPFVAAAKEAEAAVPDDLLVKTSLIGPEGHVLERLAALAESGVTTLTVRPVVADHAGRLRLLERLRGLIDRL